MTQSIDGNAAYDPGLDSSTATGAFFTGPPANESSSPMDSANGAAPNSPSGSTFPTLESWLWKHEDAQKYREYAGCELEKQLLESCQLRGKMSASKGTDGIPNSRSNSSISLELLSKSVAKVRRHYEECLSFQKAQRCCGVTRPIEVTKPFKPCLMGVDQFKLMDAYLHDLCKNVTEIGLEGFNTFVEMGPGKGVVISRAMEGYRIEFLRPLRSIDLRSSESAFIHCGDLSKEKDEKGAEWKGTHSFVFRFNVDSKNRPKGLPPEVAALANGIPEIWSSSCLQWLTGTIEMETYDFGSSIRQSFNPQPKSLLVLGSYYLLASWQPPVRKVAERK